MPGPLPDPKRRRRNAPAIPTTALPAGGRTAPAPKLPSWAKLGKAGTAWWRWAWRTPQAAGWAPGHEALVARRASLEDDAAALAGVEGLDVAEALGAEDLAELKRLIGRLASLAGGARLALAREMRELDDRLGLSPKGMAALRWEVVATAAPELEDEDAEDEVAARRAERRARLVSG